jgi:hypothetical protein
MTLLAKFHTALTKQHPISFIVVLEALSEFLSTNTPTLWAAGLFPFRHYQSRCLLLTFRGVGDMFSIHLVTVPVGRASSEPTEKELGKWGRAVRCDCPQGEPAFLSDGFWSPQRQGKRCGNPFPLVTPGFQKITHPEKRNITMLNKNNSPAPQDFLEFKTSRGGQEEVEEECRDH